ncbi:MAG: NUMOD3 domain-containing DNA-binding protein [Atribacterota bacterium]
MKKKFKRVCPKCNKDLFYKNKKNRNRAEKRGSFCLSCSQKESRKKEEIKIKYDYINKQRKEKYRGENNPFFGKKHSDRTKNHLKTQRAKNNYIYKTLDFADKISKVTSGKNNPMYGRNCYDVWVNKYGEDVARRKQAELNQKRSNNAKGSKNSMFGKTAPKGSGGGVWLV